MISIGLNLSSFQWFCLGKKPDWTQSDQTVSNWVFQWLYLTVGFSSDCANLENLTGPNLAILGLIRFSSRCAHLKKHQLDLIWSNRAQLGFLIGAPTWKTPNCTQFSQTGSSRALFFFFYPYIFFRIFLLILISKFVLLVCRWMSNQLQKHHLNSLNLMLLE